MKTLWMIALALGLSLPLAAHAGVRWCHPGEADAADQGVSDDESAAHRQFTLPAITYDRPPSGAAGLQLRYVVGEDGAIACVDDPYGQLHKAVAATPQRRALFKAMADWRYTPFQKDGKAVRAFVYEWIDEKVVFTAHDPMPAARLYGASITLQRTGCFGSCPDYMVVLHGDGRVDYLGNAFVDVPGIHHYSISPGEVAALIERLRGRNVWAMAGDWVAQITDCPTYVITLDIGGQKRTITDYVGGEVGMPSVVTDSENDIDAVAGTGDWLHLTANTLARLKSENFDFTSQAAADLLAGAVANADTTDNDAIVALIEAGAPIRGGHATPFPPTADADSSGPLDSAIHRERATVADALIAHGALTTEGKPDQALIDSAFASALSTGRMDMVQKIWPYHPSLTFQSSARNADGSGWIEKTAPVTLEIDRPYADADKALPWDGFAIARLLIDQGVDIKAGDADGKTLLHIAAAGDDPDFVKYLVDRGADVDARTSEGETPLTMTADDDTAVALLEAGADPYAQPKYGRDIFTRAQDDKMTRVQAWLDAHGLKPKPAE